MTQVSRRVRHGQTRPREGPFVRAAERDLLNLMFYVPLIPPSAAHGSAPRVNESPVTTKFPIVWHCPDLRLFNEDGFSELGTGAVSLDAGGRLRIEAILGAHLVLANFPEALTVAATTDSGELVTASLCGVTRVRGHFPGQHTTVTLVAGECVIDAAPRGDAWTERRVHLRGVSCMGRTRFTDGPRTVCLVDGAGGNEDAKGDIRATLTISATSGNDTWDDSFVDDYMMLLSVAQRVHVRAAMEQFFIGEIVVRTAMRATDGDWDSSNPLIPWFPDVLGPFLEQTLPAYRRNRETYELDILIWHYCRAHVQNVAELKFTSGSVFMEAFKFYWAKNVATLPSDQKPNGLIRGFVKSISIKKRQNSLFTFEELLTLACQSLGFETEFTFIEDRNALFHTGAASSAQRGSPNSWEALRPELVRLYDQMDDIVLRLLGYRGPIHTWAEPDVSQQFPERTVLGG